MEKVILHEVVLRDGIQGEGRYLDLNLRHEVIKLLAQAGIQSMQVASFVNPTKIPQMLGIDDWIEQIHNEYDLRLSALVLNIKGLERFLKTKLKYLDLSLSLDDSHGVKNAGKSFTEGLDQTLEMLAIARTAGVKTRVGLQCAFGRREGELPPLGRIIESSLVLCEAGCDHICLADTTGMATPRSIAEVLDALFRTEKIKPAMITLHLHDTFGLGMANFIAGFDKGIRSFDTSLGGLGGCPFVPGALGNIGTQDVLHYCKRVGIETGIDLEKLAAPAILLEQALATELPSRIYQLQKCGQRKFE